jgi:hypothetical protein
MFKVLHQVYTAEFKEAALQRVKDGQGISAVARELGMSMPRNDSPARHRRQTSDLPSGDNLGLPVLRHPAAYRRFDKVHRPANLANRHALVSYHPDHFKLEAGIEFPSRSSRHL